MKKIDRLGWAAGIAFVSYGARIGIRVNDPAVLERLLDYLPPRSKPVSSPMVDDLYSLIIGGPSTQTNIRRYNLLYWGAGLLARTMELEEVFGPLESSLHFSVALRARRRLFVHAGVVGWRGRAIVIPGRSMSGKSSLVAALVRAGATYYSDEYAVFDRQGRVYPYPKPLHLRQQNGGPTKKCPVETLGGDPGTEPLPVGLVVVTKYQQGARWRPRVLSPGQAVLALLDNTVLARIRPQLALDTLQHVVTGSEAPKGRRGESEDVAMQLLDRLAAEPVSPPKVNNSTVADVIG